MPNDAPRSNGTRQSDGPRNRGRSLQNGQSGQPRGTRRAGHPARERPRYPMPPAWPKELKQLAPNVYAYTQGGGPNIPNVGVSNPEMIAGPDYMWAIDGTQGPRPPGDSSRRANRQPGRISDVCCLPTTMGTIPAACNFFSTPRSGAIRTAARKCSKRSRRRPKCGLPAPVLTGTLPM